MNREENCVSLRVLGSHYSPPQQCPKGTFEHSLLHQVSVQPRLGRRRTPSMLFGLGSAGLKQLPMSPLGNAAWAIAKSHLGRTGVENSDQKPVIYLRNFPGRYRSGFISVAKLG